MSTSEVLAEYRKTVYSENENFDPTLITQMMKAMQTMMSEMNSRLSAIEKNTSTLEAINKKLSSLTIRMDDTEDEINQMKRKVTEIETDLQGNSNIMDKVKAANDTIGRNVTQMKVSIKNIEEQENETTEEIDDLREMYEEIKEQVLDVKCRSMKYNLIFSGIDEKAWDSGEHSENSEETIKTFIKEKLKIPNADEIPMANVHRIGKRDRRLAARPRSIIVKFIHYNDLTKIKKCAKKLQGTHYGINEQYPPEIEERRKKLYPIAKSARKDRQKAVLVRDKLYINDTLYKAPDENTAQDTPTRPPRAKRMRPNSSSGNGNR